MTATYTKGTWFDDDSGAFTRRTMLGSAAALAAPMIFRRNAWAQGKTIQMGIWGGVQGEYIRKTVIPPFEQEFGCKVLVEEGVTLSQIARMRATKDDPKYTVMFIDPLGIEISKREGLIAPLPVDKIPNMANVYPRFVLEGGYGVAFGVTAAAMFYNPQGDRRPDKLRRHVVPEAPQAPFPHRRAQHAERVRGDRRRGAGDRKAVAGSAIPHRCGLAETGGTETKRAEPVRVETPPRCSFPRGKPISARSTTPSISTRIPPRALMWTWPFRRRARSPGINCQVFVKNGPNPDIGAAFMNRMLDRSVQKGLSEAGLSAPSVDGITFAPEIARMLPYPLAKVEQMGLFTPDAANINANRSMWIEKLNQIFVS